ncbi:hypothetical protein V8C86DRAFT_3096397 [Haematococcus lacustris]
MQIGVSIEPSAIQAVSVASGVWVVKLTKGQVWQARGLNAARYNTEWWLALSLQCSGQFDTSRIKNQACRPRAPRRAAVIDWLDPRRLNVAITRAKRLLVVVGNKATLAAGGCPHWEAWMEYLEHKGWVLPAASLALS